MPYSDQDNDRALTRIYRDIEDLPDPDARGKWPLLIAWVGFMLFLAVFVLMASGCNTIAGAAADIEAAARGTQEYLADGVERDER